MRTMPSMDTQLLPTHPRSDQRDPTNPGVDMPQLCPPPSSDNPCPHQLCLVQFAPAVQRARHIDTIRGGTEALRTIKHNERPVPHALLPAAPSPSNSQARPEHATHLETTVPDVPGPPLGSSPLEAARPDMPSKGHRESQDPPPLDRPRQCPVSRLPRRAPPSTILLSAGAANSASLAVALNGQ